MSLTENKRVYAEYIILETCEAGIALHGFEVKAVKTGRANLTGAFVVIRNEEAWLLHATIAPYQAANTSSDYNPTRTRRLLLHKKELRMLIGRTQEKGLTLVPLRMYTKGRNIKVLIGIARYKQKQDRRASIKKREAAREIQRTLKKR